jgi:hypothetical protein
MKVLSIKLIYIIFMYTIITPNIRLATKSTKNQKNQKLCFFYKDNTLHRDIK